MITCAFCGEEQGFSAYEINLNDKSYPLCNECSLLFTNILDNHADKDVSRAIEELRPRIKIDPEKTELQKYVNVYLNSNGKSKQEIYNAITANVGDLEGFSNPNPILKEFNTDYKKRGLICVLVGARGRRIAIYDKKCEIKTDATLGAILTNNATDGAKTIYYSDCVGIQYKRAGGLIGYLQMETASGQMNNIGSNAFSENTFTFEETGENAISNKFMDQVYEFMQKKVEGYKYNDLDLINSDLPPALEEKRKELQHLFDTNGVS